LIARLILSTGPVWSAHDPLAVAMNAAEKILKADSNL